jgi:GAF domain-containing protein
MGKLAAARRLLTIAQPLRRAGATTVRNRRTPAGPNQAGKARLAGGTQISSGGRNLITLVLQTGRPARLDDYVSATGAAGTLVHESGIRASVGAPVSVEGRLWGLMAVTSCEEPLPVGTEARPRQRVCWQH